MRRSWIERIREMVRLRQYYMTAHATEEMAEDDLSIVDVDILHAVHDIGTGKQMPDRTEAVPVAHWKPA
jgi:hypothetical protein